MSTQAQPQSTPALSPLQGLRVIEFSQALPGSMCTMLLADLGGEVIKLENLADAATLNRDSARFLAFNRNKRSVALDLSRQEGRKAAIELAAHADVVVENLAPGTADRLGFGWEVLSGINPALIYCSLSAFGQTGPLRDKLGDDLVVQAMSGAMDVSGEPGRQPVTMGLPLGEEISGLLAAIGILAAVEKRERTGRGAFLDIAAFDASLAMLSYMANIYFATGRSSQRLGSAHPTIAPYSAFKTKDSYVVAAPFTQTFWRKFCTVIGREDLPGNPLFKSFSDRLKHRNQLAEIIDPIMLERSLAEWLVALEKGDVPNGPVNSVAAALEMDQTRARGMVVESSGPDRPRTLGTPFHFNFQDEAVFEPRFRPAPALGQDTAAVLRDGLGLDDRHLQDLVTKGVALTSKLSPDAGTLSLVTSRFPPSLVGRPSGEDDPPLKGIRVLDVTRMFAGPYCGQLLADLGAEVIKIEETRIGDPTRRNIPMVNGESTYYMAVNRGKKSITLDLKHAEGREVFLGLVANADMIIENFRPGVMDRLGLSYTKLRSVKTDIIMLSLSGFGHTGPLRDKISFDLVNQAMAGTMAITGEAGRPPVRIGFPVGDLSGGIFGTFALVAALHARQRTGKGALIDLSLHDLMVSLLGHLAQTYLMSGECPQPMGSAHPDIVPHRAYEAEDAWLVLAVPTQELWLQFAVAVGRPDLIGDARFHLMADRVKHRAELDAILEPIIKQCPAAQWIENLAAARIPCAKVVSMGEALDSEHAKSRGDVISFDHPVAGKCRSVGMAINVDGKLLLAPLPPPVLGEHTQEVLGKILGFSEEKIAALRAGGVIA